MRQAGSDSLLTANVFYEMRRRYFEGEPAMMVLWRQLRTCALTLSAGKIDGSKYLGVLFGLGQGGLTTPVPWSTE